MVDAERLVTLLARVTERLRVLDEYASWNPDELLASRPHLGDCKYTFHTTIEACTDVAQHVVASEGLERPTSNADAFERLAVVGVIDDDLATDLGAAVGFRNVLVHEYAQVDDRQVVENLDRIGAFREFVTVMTKLVQ